MSERKRMVRVGDWVSLSGKVTMLHGKEELVIWLGSTDVTMLRAEVWSEEPNVMVQRPKRRVKGKGA